MLEALAKVDEELDELDEELRKATKRVTFQFEKKRQATYQKRAETARGIKHFWSTAVRACVRACVRAWEGGACCCPAFSSTLTTTARVRLALTAAAAKPPRDRAAARAERL